MSANVLVVAPSPSVRAELRQRLQSLGLAVHACETSAEARAYSPALVILEATAQAEALTWSQELRAQGVTVLVWGGAEAAARVAQPAGPSRILAVDDQQPFLELLAADLREQGFEVILASSGEAALQRLSQQPVDCILLDRMMPGMGGEEACRRIKGTPGLRDIPLIMLTGLEDREAMIQGLSAGADDYLSKSSDPEVLYARIQTQLRRKHLEEEHRRIQDQLVRNEIEVVEARAARTLAETRASLLEDVERKNRELEAFSYSVSHDLRAPLRSIDGFSQALLEDFSPQLDERGQDYLKRVRAAAQRMSQLIDDLLELSRIGRTELRREPLDLSELAQQVIAGVAQSEPQRQVQWRVAPSMKVHADARMMQILLENLLWNAWKFTSRREGPMIEIGMEGGDPQVVFVRDNGVGFDMTYAGKLFLPFQRLHRADEFPGTGIGLATVGRIVDRHGGRIWGEGAPGRGATFRFTLPEPSRST
jgi:two-component system NtrC family sensor kinase